MGRRTNPRLAQSKPPPGKGFRGVDRERQSVGLHCLGAAAHQEISLTLTQCFLIQYNYSDSDSDTKILLSPGASVNLTLSRIGRGINPYALYQPASSGVGLYQLTDA